MTQQLDLVFLEPNRLDAVPFTTSEVVAEWTEVKHHAIQVLIDKYKTNLERFGVFSFEMRKLTECRKTPVLR